MANLHNAPRWLLQLFRALFMIFLIVEKAILHAIGFELVAFTTGVIALPQQDQLRTRKRAHTNHPTRPALSTAVDRLRSQLQPPYGSRITTGIYPETVS